jgi:hypothetical protein
MYNIIKEIEGKKRRTQKRENTILLLISFRPRLVRGMSIPLGKWITIPGNR